MATVMVTSYEIDNDLLPAVCARCGGPATGRRDLVVHILDGWKGGLLITPALVGLLFFPPLILWTLRYAQQIRVPLPVCASDLRWFESREWAEKRYLFPIWTAVALVTDVLVVLELALTGTGVSCLATFGALIGALIASAIVGRGRIGITKPPNKDARLTGVHDAFAAALAEDRARARVDDPARRAGHGDVRDDYDDEAN